MEGIRQYAFIMISGALTCGILTSLSSESHSKEIIKLLCGIFLTVLALNPILNLKFDPWIQFPDSVRETAVEAAASGSQLAQEARAAIIKEQLEAYILDKASGMGLAVSAEVTLANGNIPHTVHIQGEVSPEEKRKLEICLETELGITKEHQLWTG